MDLRRKRVKKIFIAARLILCGNGYKKAEYLKRIKLFAEFGNNNYWFPRITPADPEKVKIHNNVKVATDVYFCTHDVLHNLFMDSSEFKNVGGVQEVFGRYRNI